MQILMVLLIVVTSVLLTLHLVPWIRRIRYAKTASTPNSLAIHSVPHPFVQDTAGSRSVQPKIVQAIHYMTEPSPEGATKYSQALAELRNRAEEAVPTIYSEYVALLPRNYLLRWSLVRLLKQLRIPSSLKVLDDIIRAEIPEDKSIDKDEYIEDIMIKTMAISAVRDIASSDSEEAMDLLFQHLRHEELSVKRAAVFACFDVRGESIRSEVEQLLAKEFHELLNRPRPHPSDVATIEVAFDKQAYEDPSAIADAPGKEPAPSSTANHE